MARINVVKSSPFSENISQIPAGTEKIITRSLPLWEKSVESLPVISWLNDHETQFYDPVLKRNFIPAGKWMIICGKILFYSEFPVKSVDFF